MDQAHRLREIVKELHTDTPSLKHKINAKIIAIASGKGGVGKTNISVNLAIALAKRGKRVVLVDLDLGLANIDILLDLTIPYTLEHLILGYKTIEDITVHGPEGLKIVPGGSGLARLTDLSETERELFLNSFYQLARDNDFVIFDTAAGISNNVIKFVLAADEVIVVTTEEPTAVTDAYALMKVINLRSKEHHINLLQNMIKSPHEARQRFEKIRGVVRQFLGMDINNIGAIPYDSCVSSAIMKRKPFLTTYPFSTASKALKDITKNLLEKVENKNARHTNFFAKLSHVFSH